MEHCEHETFEYVLAILEVFTGWYYIWNIQYTQLILEWSYEHYKYCVFCIKYILSENTKLGKKHDINYNIKRQSHQDIVVYMLQGLWFIYAKYICTLYESLWIVCTIIENIIICYQEMELSLYCTSAVHQTMYKLINQLSDFSQIFH